MGTPTIRDDESLEGADERAKRDADDDDDDPGARLIQAEAEDVGEPLRPGAVP